MKLMFKIEMLLVSTISVFVAWIGYAADDSVSFPCMIIAAHKDEFVQILSHPNPDSPQITNVADGETEVKRLGPSQAFGSQEFVPVVYDNINGWIDQRQIVCRLTPNEAKQRIEDRAREAMNALKSDDSELFSAIIHPLFGVRFSPYAYIEPEQDLSFSAEEFSRLTADNDVKNWGYYDGSGEPIELTFDQYFEHFVLDRDFSNSQKITYNERFGESNTSDNSFEIYPKAIVVEYYVPGRDITDEGSDWRSLRLVFELFETQWYVVGIIHDQWTI